MRADGVEYELAPGIPGHKVDYTMAGIRIRLVPPWMEIVHQCDQCHRGDLRERVACSFEEAVEFGWFIVSTSAGHAGRG